MDQATQERIINSQLTQYEGFRRMYPDLSPLECFSIAFGPCCVKALKHGVDDTAWNMDAIRNIGGKTL